MVKRKLFGTSGIRGDARELFTNQFCFDLGRTFAKFLNLYSAGGVVAVGIDPRESSPRIKDFLVRGLLFEGRTVADQGVVPVPSLCYLLKSSRDYAGSVMISGSHIKAHLNGIKFFAFGEEILKEHEERIEEIYFSLKDKVSYDSFLPDDKGVLPEDRARDNYINGLVKQYNGSNTALKIVIDAGNGTQSEVMPYVLRRIGFEVVEINTNLQEGLISRDTEVEGDFKTLQKEVKKQKADLGIGYDSDGDRCIFVDDKGNFIPGDYTGALIAREIASDMVVTPINTSQVVEYVSKRVYRTKVGSPFVVAKMKETGAKFGFEANGGGIFSDMKTRDGGRTTVEILNIISFSKKKLSELVSELPKFYILRDKIDYKWELKDRIIEAAEQSFAGIKKEKIDGLKIWIDKKTWILFRSSQNAPEFRVFVESESYKKSRDLLNEGLRLVRNLVE